MGGGAACLNRDERRLRERVAFCRLKWERFDLSDGANAGENPRGAIWELAADCARSRDENGAGRLGEAMRVATAARIVVSGWGYLCF